MKTKKRKKYATGTPITGYIKDPSSALQQNQINIAKAEYEGETNPWALGLQTLGNLAMQYGLSMDNKNGGVGFGNSNLGKAANALLPEIANLGFAFGGKIPNVPVEIEGGEVGQTPNGTVFQAKGPSHEQGGIKTTLPEMTEMFSKRIKIDGVSMADRKKKRAKKEMTLKELLEKNSTDKLLKNSLTRTKQNNEKEEAFDNAIQAVITELLNPTNKGEIQKKGTGTPVKKDKNSSTIWDGYENNFYSIDPFKKGLLDYAVEAENLGDESIKETTINPTSKSTPQNNRKTETITPLSPLDISHDIAPSLTPNEDLRTTPPTFPKPTSNFNFGFTAGDATDVLGTLVSTLGPYLNTLHNRATDTPNINPFKNYGKEGLETMQNAEGLLEQQKDEQLKDLELTRNQQIARGRNTARGVNTMRALDSMTDENMNNYANKIYSAYNNQLMNLLFRQAQLENNRDKMVMMGEGQRDIADRQDKDNFSTSLGVDINNIGTGLQNLGRDFNTVKKNNVMMNLLNQLSKYGIKVDNYGNLYTEKNK